MMILLHILDEPGDWEAVDYLEDWTDEWGTYICEQSHKHEEIDLLVPSFVEIGGVRWHPHSNSDFVDHAVDMLLTSMSIGQG
eukprot:3209579-Amphidinium_carterae.5